MEKNNMKNIKKITLSLIFTITLLLGLISIIPSVSATIFYVAEDFNTYDDGTLPCYPTPYYFYPCDGLAGTTYTEFGSITFPTSVRTTGDNVFQFTPTTVNNGAQSQFNTHHDLCENPAFTPFEVSIGSTTGTVMAGTLFEMYGFNPVGTTSFTLYKLIFSAAGAPFTPDTVGEVKLRVEIYQNGAFFSAAESPPIVYTDLLFAADTMYRFKITCPPGPSSGTATLESADTLNVETISVPPNLGPNFQLTTNWAATAGTTSGNPTILYDDINFYYEVPSVYPGLTPSATSGSYSDIVGFDITKDGTAAGIRLNSPSQTVKFLNGATLLEQFSVDTDCNRLHGIVGLQDEGFGYLKCSPIGAPTSIQFNATNGGPYPVSNCGNPSQTCDGNFDITPMPDRNTLLDIVPTLPGINNLIAPGTTGYSNNNNYYSLLFSESGSYDTAIFDYRYTTYLGGPVVGGDAEEVNSVQVSDIGNTDVCGFGNLKAFRTYTGNPVVEIDVTNNVVFPSHIIPSSTQVTGLGTGALADGSYIDCAQDRIIVNNPTNLQIYNYDTSTVVLNMTITDGGYNTISGNGSYAAYSDGTITHIINGLTGDELAFMDEPSTLVDMEMDQCAQNLFLVTSTNVYEYDIHLNTTVVPASIQNGLCIVGIGITNTNSGSSSGSITAPIPTNPVLTGVCTDDLVCDANGNDNHFWFGVNKTRIASDFNVTEGKFNWMIGLLLIITIVLGVAAFISKSVILFAITALLGLGASVTFGLIPIWFLLLLIFIVIILAVRAMFSTGGGE